MTDLVVIVPTRGRPESAHPLIEAFASTCTADTVLAFVVDDDDPRLPDYQTQVVSGRAAGRKVALSRTASRTMVEALNAGAVMRVDEHAEKPLFAIGFMGDDHMPRTHGWDQAYLDALRELSTGIVYGNDLLQGERIPTQVAMTADIVRALGHMAPPVLKHLYVDNYWKDLGERAGCLRYLPDVIVEHRHPIAGKAKWDPGYARVNAGLMYAEDGAAYEAYAAGQLAEDVAKVRALRG